MAKETIRVSTTEAAHTFSVLLDRVSEGAEVIIEDGTKPVAVLRSAEWREDGPGRLLSESIAILKARGSTVTLDGDFGRDLEEAIKSHPEPLDTSAWE